MHFTEKHGFPTVTAVATFSPLFFTHTHLLAKTLKTEAFVLKYSSKETKAALNRNSETHRSTKPLWMLVFIFCVRCSTLAWKHRTKPRMKPERPRPATCTSSCESPASVSSPHRLEREARGKVCSTGGRRICSYCSGCFHVIYFYVYSPIWE